MLLDHSYTKRKDSTIVLLKSVPPEEIIKLIDFIDNQDTTINIDLFPISKVRLLQNIDSVYKYLDGRILPDYKSKLETLLKNQLVVKYALSDAFKPSLWDDENFYSITITTFTGAIFNISHRSFGALYHLPWIGKGIKNYDPRISILFNSILGNEYFEKRESKSLHFTIPFHIYLIYFEYFRLKQWASTQSFR